MMPLPERLNRWSMKFHLTHFSFSGGERGELGCDRSAYGGGIEQGLGGVSFFG